MTEVFVIAVASTAILLGLLSLISTMIGRHLPQIIDVLAAGAASGVVQAEAPRLHYAA